jgi:hypothetical protein
MLDTERKENSVLSHLPASVTNTSFFPSHVIIKSQKRLITEVKSATQLRLLPLHTHYELDLLAIGGASVAIALIVHLRSS